MTGQPRSRPRVLLLTSCSADPSYSERVSLPTIHSSTGSCFRTIKTRCRGRALPFHRTMPSYRCRGRRRRKVRLRPSRSLRPSRPAPSRQRHFPTPGGVEHRFGARRLGASAGHRRSHAGPCGVLRVPYSRRPRGSEWPGFSGALALHACGTRSVPGAMRPPVEASRVVSRPAGGACRKSPAARAAGRRGSLSRGHQPRELRPVASSPHGRR